jgi:hypothetical protein
MQLLTIIASFIGYLFLLIQYKISASAGAKDLAQVVSENNSLKCCSVLRSPVEWLFAIQLE